MRQSHTLRNARRPIEPQRPTPVQPSVRTARVHPALLWTPFALALVGLLFQGSIAIGELNRLTRDGYAPDPLMTLRPVLMQALWLLMGAGVLRGCSRVRGRFWLVSAWVWLLLGWGALLWLALKLPGALTLNGATRWIGAPIPVLSGITLQPAEFYKLATLLWLTAVCSAPRLRPTLGLWLGVLLWLNWHLTTITLLLLAVLALIAARLIHPDFKEPPLTPEERAALGEREDRIRRLDYTLRDELPSRLVGRWFGGVQAAAHGATLLVSRTDRVSGIARAYHAVGGVWSAEGGGVATFAGTERGGGVRTGVYGTGGASTGETGPSRIAGVKSRLDK